MFCRLFHVVAYLHTSWELLIVEFLRPELFFKQSRILKIIDCFESFHPSSPNLSIIYWWKSLLLFPNMYTSVNNEHYAYLLYSYECVICHKSLYLWLLWLYISYLDYYLVIKVLISFTSYPIMIFDYQRWALSTHLLVCMYRQYRL